MIQTTFDELFRPGAEIKFSDDPVALSCAAYRLGSYHEFSNLRPLDEDYELADKICKHYIRKLTLQRLCNKNTSRFREKLGAFLVNNRPLYNNEIGMLYHLPYFYFEDLEIESLIEDTTPVVAQIPKHVEVVLRPFRTMKIKRQGGEIKKFWWVDNHKMPYCLPVRVATEHSTFYQSIFDFSSIRVSTRISTTKFWGTERWFYQLSHTKLLGVGDK
jgi:hypothetical protein